MNKLLLLFLICTFKIWTENAKASKFEYSKRKRNGNPMKDNRLNNGDLNHYSFLMLQKENDEKSTNDNDNNSKKEKEGEENNNQKEKKNEENNANEKKNEENNASEKKNDQNNSNERKNDQNNSNEKKNEEDNTQKRGPVQPEEKINKENLLEYGTHDKDGHFIPSYKTLTNEILSTNNSLEKASNFLKIACSHVMKIVEFIPESKLSSQYIKVESKNVYIKDISTECQNIFFSLEKLTMTMIILNSKMNKLVYVQEK
ncbi:hypothetical protein, conserved [Plasmodium gonderi]|uniref:Rhoptry associated adhesin n=1 Tax=Plasmodium gonderi TaxID=77519 RepID=A0A1Y1JGT1_PLAGO|nr:hypothetical protein, conserved [Plasmodium gonderi]GAW80545.1 hypothetical protein, conserved [Plasmodium gonderi]